MVQELHLCTNPPSTATTQLRTLCLFHGQSWRRTLPTSQHAVDCCQSASLSLASWIVLAEELHRKRGQCTIHALSPFPCSSIIQTPPFPVA